MSSNQPLTIQGGVQFDQPQSPLLNYWNLNGYLFDAWLRLHHNSSLTITSHPVQTGATISDHSFVNPLRFFFEVGITDVARPATVEGGKVITESPTRVRNAYEVLRELQDTRKPLYLVSKYGFFENILIESIDIPDDWQTQNAIKAMVNLTQIIMADVVTRKVSGLPQTTDQTNRGQLAGRPVPGSRDACIQSWINLGTSQSMAERLCPFPDPPTQ
jgi:hypothetical protein